MPTIADALSQCHLIDSDTSRLDAELLLCHCLECNRTYLRTWPDKHISQAQADLYQVLLQKRAQGEPVAYLTGSQPFWTLDLKVTSATLIPRPETELLVELALSEVLPPRARILDMGTGTGAIALSIGKERPGWEMTATDKAPEALAVAQENARRNNVENVAFVCSDWFDSLAGLGTWDLIISNPPYIAPEDPHLAEGDLRFEPRSALVADGDGLADIEIIADKARKFLTSNGALLLEHGYDQAESVRKCLSLLGYAQIRSYRDLNGIERATMAWKEGAPSA